MGLVSAKEGFGGAELPRNTRSAFKLSAPMCFVDVYELFSYTSSSRCCVSDGTMLCTIPPPSNMPSTQKSGPNPQGMVAITRIAVLPLL
jgi:hypothetical protein